MISGLAITPPVVGRISIGRVVERNGKRLPEKDDQFTITTQVQSKEGWIKHPLDEELRCQSASGKLRSIPIRLPFNEPDLNFRAEYCCFDKKNGRPLCVGNGEQCKRFTEKGIEQLNCPSPSQCELAFHSNCKPYGRLNVQIGDETDVNTFIFRTTGFNSIRTLMARLSYYQAVSGGLLSCMPLELRIRGKSTTLSHRSAIYYVDLNIREGETIEQALAEAKTLSIQRKESGYQQVLLDQAAREGFANGAFEFDEEEMPEVLQEFYQNQVEDGSTTDTSIAQNQLIEKSNLMDKLMHQNSRVINN